MYSLLFCKHLTHDRVKVFGDLQHAVEKVIQRYMVEQMTEKIAGLQQRATMYRMKYNMEPVVFELGTRFCRLGIL
ncbi:hypothetical protein CSA56_05740 [candidate division KSB3 bacterium]|uniref:Uncharacterized protein n=1 Tax=candidate division KSB3 bacterium TaxID=2044937 RepID=A0A2G6KHA8_9BACT|nr:MAG: hypothetical protein CSA56_05740 [candidate division KSB3 bacterium]